ncbi:phosphoserine phosphatase [Photobacterium swingsii]|uniref:Phosphoserine phosphatase n=1 Tax=Photobacterium swingsii TaxID=680026 RepID=A0A2T3P6Q0_9GAMM|nr:phosphoserine phosphatase [Photobacterium swingsii]PSW24198.1 phosphoserine phosphatase [Photobacterium swingsii]
MLRIRKHTLLQQRFPEIIATPNLVKQKAATLIYGRAVTPTQLDEIGDQANETLQVVAAWKVGNYDAVLVSNPLQPTLLQAIIDHSLDTVATADLPDLSDPGLVLMDMDSTAIEIECIDEIAKLAGVGDEVAAVTERAMQGELDFEASLRQRVGTLEGADEAILAQVREHLPLMPELRQLVTTLQHYGWKVAIASGGFSYLSDHLKDELGLVHAHANTLEVVDGKLTGKVLGEVVDAQMKADVLVELAEHFDIPYHNTVAVGDGANDLVMMATAGLGIAYHAKPKVEAEADSAIRFADLGGVMCILSASLVPQGLNW